MNDSSQLPLLRLLQLASPVLPVGGYSYSQGLEYAVEAGWITDENTFERWVLELADGPLAQQELPLLRKLFDCLSREDFAEFDELAQLAIACRDTSELRMEERQRAGALYKIISSLPDLANALEKNNAQKNNSIDLSLSLKKSPLAGFAFAASEWNIDRENLLSGFAWVWLESQIAAALKLVPLGQLQGQSLLHRLSPALLQAVEQSSIVSTDSWPVFSCPSVSMASCAHETQYSRLFRS